MKEKLQIFTKITFMVLAFLGFAKNADAQCVAGEVAVSFDVTTDTWGYEAYWELVPTGAGCGTAATIFAGGNTTVGCNGAGLEVAAPGDPGAYGNSTTVTEGPFCLTIGSQYDIIMIDDWGDGGTDILSAPQGVNVSATAGTNTFTFTAVAPPSDADLAITASPVPYTIYPLSQVQNIVGSCNIANDGGIPAGNSQVTLNVFLAPNPVPVHSETSSGTTVAVGANSNVSFTGFTPSTVGNYLVQYIASTDSVDLNTANDTAFYIVQVNDSTYARDYANVEGITGTLGIGAGGAEDARLGQIFNLLNADTLTSVDIFIGNANGLLDGQPLKVNIYSVAGGVPTTLLQSTDVITMDTTTNTLWTLNVSNGLILPAGMFAVAVEENDSNITVGSTDKVYTTNTVFVKWNSNASGAWTSVDGFPSNFHKPLVIRPNFGTVSTVVDVEELDLTSLEVYPNPTVNNISVKNAVIGSTIEIYNNLGQIVFTDIVRTNNTNIDVVNFDNGVYTIKNISNKNIITQSFVKQ